MSNMPTQPGGDLPEPDLPGRTGDDAIGVPPDGGNDGDDTLPRPDEEGMPIIDPTPRPSDIEEGPGSVGEI